jgi:hypothetical protein
LERARQKSGRQVVPVDVGRDDVAYLEEIIGGLELVKDCCFSVRAI